MKSSLNWLIAVILCVPTGAMAAKKSGGQKRISNEKCYTRLNEMDPAVRPIFDAFLAKKSKKSFWGPVITVGGPPEYCKKQKNRNKPECQPTEENKPTQILVGKKTGTFQILRDWDQNPKSRVGSGYRLSVCANESNVFPVHLRFDLPKWFGTAHVETEIKPKNDWTKTPDKKVLNITTMVAVNGGQPSLYKKSTLDIQPMINEYMASAAPAVQPDPPVAAERPPALASTVPSVTAGPAVPEPATEAEIAR